MMSKTWNGDQGADRGSPYASEDYTAAIAAQYAILEDELGSTDVIVDGKASSVAGSLPAD